LRQPLPEPHARLLTARLPSRPCEVPGVWTSADWPPRSVICTGPDGPKLHVVDVLEDEEDDPERFKVLVVEDDLAAGTSTNPNARCAIRSTVTKSATPPTLAACARESRRRQRQGLPPRTAGPIDHAAPGGGRRLAFERLATTSATRCRAPSPRTTACHPGRSAPHPGSGSRRSPAATAREPVAAESGVSPTAAPSEDDPV